MTEFFITDVFSEARFCGNQLATLLDAAHLPSDVMQRIAREFNFSESTFVTGGDLDAGFDVRIFTPNNELPFAGHPVLGTAFLIREELLKEPVEQVVLNLGVGRIPVTFDGDLLWMRQRAPTFGQSVVAEEVAAALGLSVDALEDYPAQFVSTGLEFLLVPVRNLATLRSIRKVESGLARAVFVFCREGYESGQTIAARMFAPDLGVPEDPATGSANGCLAAYIIRHGYLGEDEIDIRVGQGYEVGRPSCLYLRAGPRDDEIEVRVGGKVTAIARGTIDA